MIAINAPKFVKEIIKRFLAVREVFRTFTMRHQSNYSLTCHSINSFKIRRGICLADLVGVATYQIPAPLYSLLIKKLRLMITLTYNNNSSTPFITTLSGNKKEVANG